MNTKQMTAHLRNRIKVAGVKARVRFWPDGQIQVFAPAYGVEFSEDEQRAVRHIAVCNRLTLIRAQPINVEQMTNPTEFSFYLGAA